MKTPLPILNLLRHGDFEDRGRISLREAVCIANAEAGCAWSCNECIHCGTDSDGGEPEYSQSWPVCNLNDKYNNLKSFPFKIAPARCFQLDYYASAYVHTFDFDGTGSWTNSPSFQIWNRTDRYGRYDGPLELGTEQWETDGGGAADPIHH